MEAYLGEFLGTALLILLGGGVCANVSLPQTKGQGSGWIVISFGWAMAVFVAVWCVGEMSGAHINPAVTIGLAAADEFEWAKVPGFLTAQLAGAMVGAAVVWLAYYDHFKACDEPATKLGVFATGPAIRNYPFNVLSEVVGTFVLVLAVLLAADPSVEWPSPTSSTAEEQVTTKVGLGALGALPVGLLVLAIGLSLGGTTGYAINPARDLGPRIAHALLPIPAKGSSDWSYAWVPIAGPLIGALLAAVVVRIIG
ncbi:aquaporin family protein [Aeoliella sp. ICT_H6.2]|uniref:Aquaporin family protein n=1 Tax=Aeoliella straminimaris TaxID=2954799 RepID=A0A9X2FDR0_9BACT|nr:MIP/aquaporin family protein [Aeoliella straminimaris]MCO6046749.1 aquaporin family protein [Aeoliella straminimaris]